MFALGHQFRRLMQALFGLDHVACREPLFAAHILAEFDQIGRAPHRTYDLVELLDPSL